MAAEHPLGQLVGSTLLSVHAKGLVGSCKRREGFLSPSSLCVGCRADMRQGSGPAAGSSTALQSDGCPGAAVSQDPAPGVALGFASGAGGVPSSAARLPLPDTLFVLQRQYGCCLRNPISLKYKICFKKLWFPHSFSTLNAILIHF